jgi:hypothetical protein
VDFDNLERLLKNLAWFTASVAATVNTVKTLQDMKKPKKKKRRSPAKKKRRKK